MGRVEGEGEEINVGLGLLWLIGAEIKLLRRKARLPTKVTTVIMSKRIFNFMVLLCT